MMSPSKIEKIMDISVIIPAYNEEDFITATVKSVIEIMPLVFQYEVIVVDHGSTDHTIKLAKSAGACVLDFSGAPTISALRNRGVKHSKGRILVFLDSDTTLADPWGQTIPDVIRSLDKNPLQLTGSKRGVPDDAGTLAQYWFAPKAQDPNPTHLGGGHIITTRILFDTIQGFPEEMETGEDFRFCINAKKAGAILVAVPSLRAIHNGLPNTITQFFSRETWHGRGDWTSWQTVFTTKVAMLTLLFILFHLIFLTSLFLLPGFKWLAVGSLLAILGTCSFAATIKYWRSGLGHVLGNSFMYYVYFSARAISFFTVIFDRKTQKHHRG